MARTYGTAASCATAPRLYGYPVRAAAQIAVRTIAAELAGHPLPAVVILCTFDDAATEIAREVLAASLAPADAPLRR